MRALVNVIVGVGMLAVVPTGLRLIGGGAVRWLAGRWHWGAGAGAVALWLPRGPVALALATAYACLTLPLAAVAVVRLLRRRSEPDRRGPRLGVAGGVAAVVRWGDGCWVRRAGAVSDLGDRRGSRSEAGPGVVTDGVAVPIGGGRVRRTVAVDVAVTTALAAPMVAAVALVAERAGYALFGFEMGILALTVAHFHFAGFAAALTAGLVSRLADGRWTRAAAWTVPAGTGVVFAGYFVGETVELAGALVLTAGMWLVGWAMWHQVRPAVADPAARALLGVSAAVLAVSMLLAVSWALGEATGLPHPSLGWMAATHGVANALGFGLCGLLAWRRLRLPPL